MSQGAQGNVESERRSGLDNPLHLFNQILKIQKGKTTQKSIDTTAAEPEARRYDGKEVIAGRGPAEQDLRQLARSMGLSDCIRFEGFVPYPDLPKLLARADIGVATSRHDCFRRYASPLKIVEYMAAGLPVICSGGGEAEQMIEDSKAGVNIPFEPKAFAEAVQSLWVIPGNLSAVREAAIHYARSRSWEQMGTLMAQLVSRVTGGANPIGRSC